MHRLKAHGVYVWLDRVDSDVASALGRLADAIEVASVFIAIRPGSDKRLDWVNWEAARACKLNKRILEIVTPDSARKPQLALAMRLSKEVASLERPVIELNVEDAGGLIQEVCGRPECLSHCKTMCAYWGWMSLWVGIIIGLVGGTWCLAESQGNFDHAFGNYWWTQLENVWIMGIPGNVAWQSGIAATLLLLIITYQVANQPNDLWRHAFVSQKLSWVLAVGLILAIAAMGVHASCKLSHAGAATGTVRAVGIPSLLSILVVLFEGVREGCRLGILPGDIRDLWSFGVSGVKKLLRIARISRR